LQSAGPTAAPRAGAMNRYPQDSHSTGSRQGPARVTGPPGPSPGSRRRPVTARLRPRSRSPG